MIAGRQPADEQDFVTPDLAEFRAAVSEAMGSGGGAAGRLGAVAEVGAAALPGDGGAITLMLSDQGRETLAVTDQVIAAVERAQFTVGEGPSLDVLTRNRPVLVPDLGNAVAGGAWPGLVAQLADLDVGAVFAFPLRLGASVIGVALSYRHLAGHLSRIDIAFALRAADVITLAVLRIQDTKPAADDGAEPPIEDRAGDRGSDDDGPGNHRPGDDVLGAREVHQATGMVMVQLGGVAATTAFAQMRARAFADDQTIEDIAAAIVARRLVLDADDP